MLVMTIDAAGALLILAGLSLAIAAAVGAGTAAARLLFAATEQR